MPLICEATGASFGVVGSDDLKQTGFSAEVDTKHVDDIIYMSRTMISS